MRHLTTGKTRGKIAITRRVRMITVERLTKKYGATLAVDDVSFTAAAGRVTGFLGPNGAGKSTTMRIMVGLTRADVRNRHDRRAEVRGPAQPGARGGRPARRVRASTPVAPAARS